MNRVILAACGTATGLYCGTAAFRMGFTMASTWEGYVFGLAFVSVVVGSWFLLPRAAQAKQAGDKATMWALRGGYALAFLVIVLNAVGFTALHRTNSVEAKTGVIEQYDNARDENSQLFSDLKAAKLDVAWSVTASCTRPQSRSQRAFCARVEGLDGRVQANKAVLRTGRPGEADPTAATVAWVTGLDAASVGRADPIVKALALEILTTIFWLGAMAGGRSPKAIALTVTPLVRVKSVAKNWADTKTGRSLSARDRGVITRQINKLQKQLTQAK